MKCRWMEDFNGICCNADCPACADYCPVSEYSEICKHAEEQDTPTQTPTDKATVYSPIVRRHIEIGGGKDE